MKKILIIVIALISVGYAQNKKDTTKKTLLTKKDKVVVKAPAVNIFKDSDDSLSYALGLEGALYYNQQGIKKLNSAMVKKAFDDVYNNKTPLIEKDKANMLIQRRLQEYMAAKSKTEKEAGKKFLEENKKRQGVITLPDGLQYEVIKQGTGEKPTDTSTVKAHYIGTLINGTEFDNSYKRGEPLEIPVGGVIKGWTEALKMMPVGSKWKLYIPSELGYGEQGAGNGIIPGGATLVFVVELIDIVKKK
jgi:FKBP-type peptidyl-prolyl cis-trans isomerase FklB